MPPGGMRGAMRSMRQDASVIEKSVRPGTTGRILKFASPYAALLAIFLVVVIFDAAIGVANPLIYREIIDNGILLGNGHLVLMLALLVGGLAIIDAALGLAQSYLSSRIGLS